LFLCPATICSALLAHGHAGHLTHEHMGPMLIYVCCARHAFLMFYTLFL
jgi:hypothetical protein